MKKRERLYSGTGTMLLVRLGSVKLGRIKKALSKKWDRRLGQRVGRSGLTCLRDVQVGLGSVLGDGSGKKVFLG